VSCNIWEQGPSKGIGGWVERACPDEDLLTVGVVMGICDGSKNTSMLKSGRRKHLKQDRVGYMNARSHIRSAHSLAECLPALTLFEYCTIEPWGTHGIIPNTVIHTMEGSE